jgi:hypothetical protein
MSGSIKIRNKCRWWRKKYQAKAKVWFPGFWNTKGKGDCTHAHVNNNMGFAQQISWVGTTGHGFYGWSFWWAGHGIERSIPNLFKMDSKSMPTKKLLKNNSILKNIEHSSITFNHIFDKKTNTIHIQNLNGEISVPLNKKFSSELEFIIWKSSDKFMHEDELITKDKILWHGKIEISEGGKIDAKGGFDDYDYKALREEGLLKIKINGINKVIKIDDKINLDDIEIFVKSHGEGGGVRHFEKELYETHDFLSNPENQTSLITSINPTLDEVVVTFSLPDTFDNVKLSLLDINGKIKNTFFNGLVEKNIPLTVNVNDLELDKWPHKLILLEYGDKKLLRLESLYFDYIDRN